MTHIVQHKNSALTYCTDLGAYGYHP